MQEKNKRSLGAEKEQLAAEYLKKKGFHILEKKAITFGAVSSNS